ncbi:radical SAM protein [Chondromyces crocatus]|uniref:Radical SAM core domain-containing protein n=1 Tax=Chondromyces crocatus TaxID=52 RepID=A0A0K1EN35_CHOCO|nr:radical SAM protein [Chondromyces crocatus]AKT42264.1 uncharacterized protein CMC5_064870 [Chondromyces crocatus]
MEASERPRAKALQLAPPLPSVREEHAPIPRAEAWWAESLLVTFAFRCNLACTFCMVEDALDVYAGTSLEEMRRATRDPTVLRGAKRIIFSGGEVTLAKDLLAYVEAARQLPGIEHVRLQTNGVRLVDKAYLRALLDAGVDELFISLHAPDAETCDAVTQRRGSFRRILAGIEAVAESGAALFTNTAIVKANFEVLPEIVSLVAPFGPRSMEFWNYWPRGDEEGARGMNARVSEVREPLLEALGRCVMRGIPPVVKWFPRCLLGEFAACHDDGQPPSLIEDRYWEREPSYGCIYEGVCQEAPARPGGSTAGACVGLSDSYVFEHGWEEQVLAPRRGVRGPGRDDGEKVVRGDAAFADAAGVGRSLTADAGPRRSEQAVLAEFLKPLDLHVGMRFGGSWALQEVGRARGAEGALVTLTFTPSAPGGRVIVRLHGRDPARRCAVRTKSFDVSYRVEGAVRAEEAAGMLRLLFEQLDGRDPGGLRLP